MDNIRAFRRNNLSRMSLTTDKAEMRSSIQPGDIEAFVHSTKMDKTLRKKRVILLITRYTRSAYIACVPPEFNDILKRLYLSPATAGLVFGSAPLESKRSRHSKKGSLRINSSFAVTFDDWGYNEEANMVLIKFQGCIPGVCKIE